MMSVHQKYINFPLACMPFCFEFKIMWLTATVQESDVVYINVPSTFTDLGDSKELDSDFLAIRSQVVMRGEGGRSTCTSGGSDTLHMEESHPLRTSTSASWCGHVQPAVQNS